MTRRSVVMEISALEATHLAGLIEQFLELIEDSAPGDDAALARLTPDAYPDDAEASDEFRRITRSDLLDRRADDARTVLTTLVLDGGVADADAEAVSEASGAHMLFLDAERVGAWLRTLAVVRLVLASRLGITREDDHDSSDARYGIYDWLGYRLDGLVQAADADS